MLKLYRRCAIEATNVSCAQGGSDTSPLKPVALNGVSSLKNDEKKKAANAQGSVGGNNHAARTTTNHSRRPYMIHSACGLRR
jgi:hypothetical protein